MTDPTIALARFVLDRAGCLALLAPGGHGRVAATMRAVPVIIPAAYTLLGEDVILAVGAEDGHSRAVAEAVVAFEADQPAEGGATWAVHVTGVAHPIGPGRFRLSSEIISGWRVD